MTILENTLECQIERWDDPGDYPNGAGSRPLPSYNFVASVAGECVIEFTEEELDAYRDEEGIPGSSDEFVIRSIIESDDFEQPDIEGGTVKVTDWKVDVGGRKAVLKVEDFNE